MKNLILRALSGAVYVALICAGVLIDEWTLFGLCSFFVLLAVNEFSRLCNNSLGALNTVTLVVDIVGALAAYIFLGGLSLGLPGVIIAIAGCIFAFYILWRPVIELYCKTGASPLTRLAYSYMGLVYIVLPFILLSLLWTSHKYLALGMFIMIWLNDTGAFLVGSAMGKHRLFPRVSPKKSWEGFFGGLVFCISAAFVYKFCFPSYFANYPLIFLCFIGAIVCIFSTWGDLVESLIKRAVGVKDSGNLIPGHGGILDRIDSLLLVAPATCFFVLIYLLF